MLTLLLTLYDYIGIWVIVKRRSYAFLQTHVAFELLAFFR